VKDVKSNRTLVRTGARVVGECAVRVPLAGRVLSQLLDPTTPPWRRAVLMVVLFDAVAGAIEAVQQPSAPKRVRSMS
jgi:hypothetical protein